MQMKFRNLTSFRSLRKSDVSSEVCVWGAVLNGLFITEVIPILVFTMSSRDVRRAVLTFMCTYTYSFISVIKSILLKMLCLCKTVRDEFLF